MGITCYSDDKRRENPKIDGRPKEGINNNVQTLSNGQEATNPEIQNANENNNSLLSKRNQIKNTSNEQMNIKKQIKQEEEHNILNNKLNSSSFDEKTKETNINSKQLDENSGKKNIPILKSTKNFYPFDKKHTIYNDNINPIITNQGQTEVKYEGQNIPAPNAQQDFKSCDQETKYNNVYYKNGNINEMDQGQKEDVRQKIPIPYNQQNFNYFDQQRNINEINKGQIEDARQRIPIPYNHQNFNSFDQQRNINEMDQGQKRMQDKEFQFHIINKILILLTNKEI